MQRDLTPLADDLRQVAFEAGCVVLGLTDADVLPRCITRYNRLLDRLHTLAPDVTIITRTLADDTPAGDVRIAARTAAVYLTHYPDDHPSDTDMDTGNPTNDAVADALEQAADRLTEHGANPHRVQAYRFAAQTVHHTEHALAEIWKTGGVEALKALPGIGDRLAERIAGFVETGRLSLLDGLRVAPERLFLRVPGIGPELARRLYDELGVETLEALELAAHDGRLAEVEGFGPGRVRALRAQLNDLLSARSHRRARRFRQAQPGRAGAAPETPSVALLLDVDRLYRQRSTRDELRRIAPRRFNPSGVAWLPILNTRHGGWRFTALFSNTARAHDLGKTDDWVVIYAEQNGHKVQHTTVTETRGDLKGERVVRGREGACRTYYRERACQAA